MDEKNFTPLQLKPLDKTTNIKKIILYFLLLILVIIFVATVGMTLLINGTMFLSKKNQPSPSPKLSQTNNSLLTPPEFDAFPTATNSAKFIISGKAPTNQTISIMINAIQVATFDSKNGKFEGEVKLEEGENIITASYTDDETRTQKSSNQSKISLISTPPKLELTSPKEGDEISGSEIKIEGFTDKEVIVNINAIPVVVDAEGKFSYNFLLKNGINEIKIIAKDIAGNVTEQDLSLNFSQTQ